MIKGSRVISSVASGAFCLFVCLAMIESAGGGWVDKQYNNDTTLYTLAKQSPRSIVNENSRLYFVQSISEKFEMISTQSLHHLQPTATA